MAYVISNYVFEEAKFPKGGPNILGNLAHAGGPNVGGEANFLGHRLPAGSEIQHPLATFQILMIIGYM
jgi:hypothetical protein